MTEPAISRREGLTLWQAALWPDRAAEGASALAAAAGVAVPARGRIAEGPGGALAQVGPLKWWLVDGGRPALDPALGVLLDLSCEQVAFRIGGPRAADLLARIVALDLRPRAFPPGAFAATGGHHLMLKLRRLGDGEFELFAMRSYAGFLAEVLEAHAGGLAPA